MVPFLEIGGVGGYIPEGYLTACSFDYLDTSPSNYWFIFIYAIVSNCRTFEILLFQSVVSRSGRILFAFGGHRLLLLPHTSCCADGDKDSVKQGQEQNRSETGCNCHGNRRPGE